MTSFDFWFSVVSVLALMEFFFDSFMVESIALAEVAEKVERPRNPGWDNIKPAQKGEVRNPRGRPLGARTKLAEAYLADLYEAWQTDGPHAIAETVKRKPWEFVNIVCPDASEGGGNQQICEHGRC